MTTEKKIMTAQCIFCGKEVFSMYEGQLTHNIKMHEQYCKERFKEEKDGA